MARLRTALLGACVLGSVIAVVGGWAAGPPARPLLDAEAARTFTSAALADAGFDDVVVAPEVTADRYRPEGIVRSRDVWRTTALVAGAEVRVVVDQAAGRAVELDDTGPAGAVLSDEQFRRLARFESPYDGRRDWFVEQGFASGAAVLIVGVGSVLLDKNRSVRP
ncbi:hypothetical protein BH20ACT2_BH20ACT2_14960 [soil metagenome]